MKATNLENGEASNHPVHLWTLGRAPLPDEWREKVRCQCGTGVVHVNWHKYEPENTVWPTCFMPCHICDGTGEDQNRFSLVMRRVLPVECLSDAEQCALVAAAVEGYFCQIVKADAEYPEFDYYNVWDETDTEMFPGCYEWYDGPDYLHDGNAALRLAERLRLTVSPDKYSNPYTAFQRFSSVYAEGDTYAEAIFNAALAVALGDG